MKITEITYKQNFAYNPIQMEHIHLGVTIEINDDKEAERAFEMAKQMVHETYENILKSMPVPLYEDHKVPEKQVDKPTDKIQGWIQVIELTTNVPALERFKPQVDKEHNQKLYEAYNKQLEKLTNKK